MKSINIQVNHMDAGYYFDPGAESDNNYVARVSGRPEVCGSGVSIESAVVHLIDANRDKWGLTEKDVWDAAAGQPTRAWLRNLAVLLAKRGFSVKIVFLPKKIG